MSVLHDLSRVLIVMSAHVSPHICERWYRPTTLLRKDTIMKASDPSPRHTHTYTCGVSARGGALWNEAHTKQTKADATHFSPSPHHHGSVSTSVQVDAGCQCSDPPGAFCACVFPGSVPRRARGKGRVAPPLVSCSPTRANESVPCCNVYHLSWMTLKAKLIRGVAAGEEPPPPQPPPQPSPSTRQSSSRASCASSRTRSRPTKGCAWRRHGTPTRRLAEARQVRYSACRSATCSRGRSGSQRPRSGSRGRRILWRWRSRTRRCTSTRPRAAARSRPSRSTASQPSSARVGSACSRWRRQARSRRGTLGARSFSSRRPSRPSSPSLEDAPSLTCDSWTQTSSRC
mmetsp:Transcript_14114/g.46366  ORF Transcript_14114/g.46366 Transcript_14114/m.46366 type:complete len:344 (+) Transcript_14114:1298-2329(+)